MMRSAEPEDANASLRGYGTGAISIVMHTQDDTRTCASVARTDTLPCDISVWLLSNVSVVYAS
jgi:hypothetical protein